MRTLPALLRALACRVFRQDAGARSASIKGGLRQGGAGLGLKPLARRTAKTSAPALEDVGLRARLEAEAWRVRLDGDPVSEATYEAFRAWRRVPHNAAAFARAERAAQVRAVMVSTRARAAPRRRGREPSW